MLTPTNDANTNNSQPSNAVTHGDTLKSLEYAIVEALMKGADPKDIPRVVKIAESNFYCTRTRTQRGRSAKSIRPGNRTFYLMLTICNVMFSIARIFSHLDTQQFSTESDSYVNEFSPLGTQLLAAAGDADPGLLDRAARCADAASCSAESARGYLREIVRARGGEAAGMRSGAEPLHPASRQTKEDRLKTAIAQHDSKAISEFLLDLSSFDKTNHCPLDAFFHDSCETRGGGTVCIYPGGILKQVRDRYLKREMLGLKLLNDTRYFPKTYFVDEECSYMIQENVNTRRPSKSDNRWCANYTYYRDFYHGAFKIFNAVGVIPNDLNTCCNTVVNGDDIRIIDFGKYDFGSPPEDVRIENKQKLKDILSDVEREVGRAQKKCAWRRTSAD